VRLVRPSIVTIALGSQELIALPERLLAGTLGRALEDRDGVADLFHDAGTPRRELLGREDLRTGEDWLGRRCLREHQQAGDEETERRTHAQLSTP